MIGSTTPALARCLTQVLAQQVHPLPLVAPPLVEPGARSPALRYDVVLPGEFRWEKGAGMVESILLGLARLRPDLRVSLQVRDQEQAQALVQSLRQQQFAASLDIVYGALDMAAYAQRLGAARLALLPYQPQRYALRCSGVAFECFMHGIPVVAPAGTWIADQIEAGLATGVLFHDWESDAIAQATLQALNQLDTLGVTARRLAPGWASQGGATPMLSRICALLGLQ